MDLFKRAIQKYYTDSDADDAIDAAYEIIKDEEFNDNLVGKAFKLFLMASSQKEHIGINEKLIEFSKNQKDLPAEAVFFMRDAFIAAGSRQCGNNIVLRYYGLDEVNPKECEANAEEEASAEEEEEANAKEEPPIAPVAPIEDAKLEETPAPVEDAEEAEEAEEIPTPKFPKLTRQDNFPPANANANAKGGSKSKGIKGKGHKTRRASSQQKQASKRKA